jgi:prolipoprotein diacylglyceryltransferase
MATPLTQATGRLRCLVQGCCHGGLTTGPGIRYFNPHTRVGAIPALSGQCIHNTQGYSILTNVLIAAILFRMQWAGATAALLGGTYFILTGMFRFIEESRRGEPQTKMIAGLRLYQWIALGSVAFGALLTRIPDHTPLSFEWNFSGPMWIASLVSGLAWSFGMSMDFPEGKSRFSRLTG